LENLMRHALAGDREHVRWVCEHMHDPAQQAEKERENG
jgi:hypothetical protein